MIFIILKTLLKNIMKNKILLFSSTGLNKNSAGSIRIRNIYESISNRYQVDLISFYFIENKNKFQKNNNLRVKEYYINKKFLIYGKFLNKIINKILYNNYVLFFLTYITLIKIYKQYKLIFCSAPNYWFIISIILIKKDFIIDMRDLWTKDKRKKKNIINSYLEKKLLDKAKLIIVSTNTMVKYHNMYRSKIKVVYNCTSPIKIINNNYSKYNKYKDSIVFTGTLYDSQIYLLKKFATVFKNYKIYLIGSFNKNVISMGLPNNIFFEKRTSYEDSLLIQRSAKYLLVFAELDWIAPAKIFDYFRVKKPIIGVGYDNICELQQILKQTNSGLYLSSEYLDLLKNDFTDPFVNKMDGFTFEVDRHNFRNFTRVILEIIDGI